MEHTECTEHTGEIIRFGMFRFSLLLLLYLTVYCAYDFLPTL
jgi:hypothetical protein